MKKLLFITLALGIANCLFAQKNSLKVPNSLAGQSMTAKRSMAVNQSLTSDTGNYLPMKPKTIVGNSIGSTWYDLQSNKSVSNRIIKCADGSISAIWTRGFNSGTDYNDRGTGYNYFDGTSWLPLPTDRIEDIKTGFPSLTLANGKEIVISHNSLGLTWLLVLKDPETGQLIQLILQAIPYFRGHGQ